MKKNPDGIRLLPNYFQKIAALFFIGSIVGLFFMKGYLKLGDLSEQIAGNGILISFLIYILAAQKMEDELTIKTRLKVFAVSFHAMIIYAIVEPYINYLFGDGFVLDSSASEMIRMGIIFYFVITLLTKGEEE